MTSSFAVHVEYILTLSTPGTSILSVCSGRTLKGFLQLCGWKNDAAYLSMVNSPGWGWSHRLK